MRYLSIFIAIIFLVFSAVQYNDPDPFVWIGIYGLVTLVAILVFLKKAPEILLWILLPIYLGGCLYIWPEKFEGVSMPMHTKPWIEEAREALGLLIAFMSLLTLLFIQRKTKVQEN